jgi:hypothetical protein
MGYGWARLYREGGDIVLVRNTGNDLPVHFEKPELPVLLKEVLAF